MSSIGTADPKIPTHSNPADAGDTFHPQRACTVLPAAPAVDGIDRLGAQRGGLNAGGPQALGSHGASRRGATTAVPTPEATTAAKGGGSQLLAGRLLSAASGLATWAARQFGYEGAGQHELIYVSSLPVKVREMRSLMQGVKVVPRTVPNLPTVESLDLETVAAFRAQQAFAAIGKPLVIDESALDLFNPAWKAPFPGHLFKHSVLQQMGTEAFARHFKNYEGTVRVVFAYTNDGKNVQLFDGAMDGKVVHPLRCGTGVEGQDWCGWDALWQPKGSDQTLAENYAVRHIMTHRQFGALELRSYLFGDKFPGVYELHVTVDHPPQDEGEENDAYGLRLEAYIHGFQSACRDIGHGSIVVNNITGKQRFLQLQTKKYVVEDSAADAIRTTFEVGQDLTNRGFKSIRHRAEAMFHNRDVPQTDEEALASDPTKYFEMHLRVMDMGGEPLTEAQATAVRNICAKHHARMSMVGNKYFVNQRYYNVGKKTAGDAWAAVVEDVKAAGFATKKIPLEYTVFDDRISHDSQWKAPEGETKLTATDAKNAETTQP